MKIVCDQCQARYAIKDERVRGKSLKIKCKKCGRIISVSDPAHRASMKPAAAAPGPKDAAAEAGKQEGSLLENRFADSFRKPAAKTGASASTLFAAVQQSAKGLDQDELDTPCWFVAIDDQPVGPIGARRVHEYRVQSKVTDESLVWKDGMLDWTALGTCRELVDLLGQLDRAASAPVKPTGPLPQPRVQKGLFQAPVANEPAKIDVDPLRGMHTGAIGASTAVLPPSEPAAAEAEKKPAGTQGDALAAWGKDMGQQEITNVTSIYPPTAVGSGRSWKLLFAVGFFVACIAVFAVVILTGENTPETVIKEKIIEKTQVIYRDRPEMAQKENGDAQSKTSGAKVGKPASRTSAKKKWSGAAAQKGGHTGSGALKAESAEARKRRLLAQMSADVPGGSSKLAGRSLSGGSSGGSTGSSGGLSQRQMGQVVSRNKGSLQLCYERALKKGIAPADKDLKVLFNVSVGASGVIKKLSISGSGARVGELKSCLTASIKKWMFPASGGTATVQFPIVFTPAR